MTRALAPLLVLLVAAGTTAAEPPAETAARPVIRLVQSGRGWVVEARLDDRVPGRFLLDTGATSCVVTPLVAGQLGRFPPARHTDVDTAGGPVRAGVIRLRSLSVGPHRAEGVQALVLDELDPGLDGVIGLNFLDQFAYTIDARRGILELR